MKKLTEKDCKTAISNGDFDSALVSGSKTVIVMTQSWCPQWAAMRAYIPALEESHKDINIYYVEYDIEPGECFESKAFMEYKENVLKNREIPYLRYYIDGVFSGESNFVSKDVFLKHLNI